MAAYRQLPESGTELNREQLSEWLGIGLDETLVVYPGRWGKLLAGGLGWLLVGLLGAAICMRMPMPRSWTEPWLLLQLLWLLPAPVHVLGRVHTDGYTKVRAKPDGLSYFSQGMEWHPVAWEHVISVERIPRIDRGRMFYWTSRALAADEQVQVRWLDGTFRFHPKDVGAQRLEEALRHVLAARESGQALPRMMTASSTAISPAEPTELVVERGISRA